MPAAPGLRRLLLLCPLSHVVGNPAGHVARQILPSQRLLLRMLRLLLI
jgi:hypothetical protein